MTPYTMAAVGSPSALPPPPPPTQTAAYLEWLASQLMEAHNSLPHPDAVAFLHAHCDPHVTMLNASAHECPLPPSESVDHLIANFLELKRERPGFEVVTENATAQVDEMRERAVVWVTTRGSRMNEDRVFNRESVSLLHFYKREADGVWVWYKHVSIRGGGDFFA